MYTTLEDAPLPMNFTEAALYARKMKKHGHYDWRVPTINELNVLFNNRAAIGGFNANGSRPGSYWSSDPTTIPDNHAWNQSFSTGEMSIDRQHYNCAVRCVR